MAKRGCKLQEFVAHSASVTCIKIGKKTRRLFITGGEDQKVNIWSIGSSTSLMSLCGHTSAVESVSFDSREILVVAGASMGAVKLWDLEETKMVRTVTGHRSNCTAVEFHPFGEFFASGSMDSNLKIWDIRKKGCIHTYKGHTRGINTVRFTPDGRWVVSGGLDNVVKVWDLTAGKLLHDIKSHEGHIRSIEFHPLEFFLATGSLDGTIKFWDLETFELIGSAGPEATGVRSIAFHPDGRTLFCGLDDSLRVYSWEPVICHDGFDMGWATLGDLSIHDEKLLGCSYYQNSVRVWVADISLIEPYQADFTPEQNGKSDHKFDPCENPLEKVGRHRRSTSSMSCMSPDLETKEIKNIYVDTAGGNPATLKRVGSLSSQKLVVPSDSKEKEIAHLPMQKLTHAVGLHTKTIGQANSKSSVVHSNSILSLENHCGKETSNSKRESLTAARASIGITQKPPHIRRRSATKFKFDMEGQSMAIESRTFSSVTSDLESATDQNFHSRIVPDEASGSCDEYLKCSGVNSVKFVNGVAVVEGRTRTLVERFERKERLNNEEFQTPDKAAYPICETAKTSLVLNRHLEITERELASANDQNITEDLMQNHDLLLSTLHSRLTKLQVMRHFWEQNDIKGVINAMEKLPDHSVQADVIGVVMEKMENFTLDLFSCLLPVLLSLLNSKRERHVNVSLEMLLKLVAMFGPVVHSTISAPPAVGVDLQADKRLECCNQCFIHLEKIQKFLPALLRRGGLLAKSAQELNLVLQGS